MYLYQVIRERREKGGYTRKEIADLVGTIPDAIADFENGDWYMPFNMLDMIMKLLEIESTDYNDHGRSLNIKR